jgi:hypothetical protein
VDFVVCVCYCCRSVEDAFQVDVGLACADLLDDGLEAVHLLALRVLVGVVRDELDARRVRERSHGLILEKWDHRVVSEGGLDDRSSVAIHDKAKTCSRTWL